MVTVKGLMSNHERVSTTSYGVPLGAQVTLPDPDGKIAAALSREAAERDLAMIRAMNAPAWQPTEPEVRAPIFPDNWQELVAQLDQDIVERGVGVDRKKLVALGQERFARLLEADGEARNERVIGTKTDLTSWPSVQFAFATASALATGVPRRKTSEAYAGVGDEREQAAQILGFGDLWKAIQEPRAVRAIYKFRDTLEDLVFGRSLLERLNKNGRARSSFFAGGSGQRVDLFRSWLSVLQPPLVSIEVVNPLWSLFQWAAQDKAPPVDSLSLAQEFSGLRAPSLRELKLAQAVLNGVLLNLDDWTLWDYCGRCIRASVDHALLMSWRRELVKRYPVVTAFHRHVASCFYRREGDHLRFQPRRYRLFIDRMVSDSLAAVSALVAVAVADCKPVARFQTWVFTEQPPTAIAEIYAALARAFPGARFQLDIK